MEQILLNRYGKIFKFDGDEDDVVSVHHEIAKKILPNENFPLDILMNQGWIIIGSHFLPPYSAIEPNQAQINILYELGISKIKDYNSGKFWILF